MTPFRCLKCVPQTQRQNLQKKLIYGGVKVKVATTLRPLSLKRQPSTTDTTIIVMIIIIVMVIIIITINITIIITILIIIVMIIAIIEFPKHVSSPGQNRV